MSVSRRSLCLVTAIALLLWAGSVCDGAIGVRLPEQARSHHRAFAAGRAARPDRTRSLANKLQTALGQSVIVENRAGAGGMVGTAYVAKTAAGRLHRG